MPKQTFLNLPESKRQAIIDLAIEEFAEHDYRSASISRIVARAGIAKGSIYQYFEDKRDLFTYLLDLMVQEKMAVLKEMPPPPGTDFFSYLRWMAALGARVQLAHPRLATVAYRAYFGNLPFHDEAVAQMKEASLRHIGQMVQRAIAEGDVDPAIDPELAVFVVNTLITELGNFLFRRTGAPALRPDGTLDVDTRAAEQVFDDFVRVLQYGLANRARANDRKQATVDEEVRR